MLVVTEQARLKSLSRTLTEFWLEAWTLNSWKPRQNENDLHRKETRQPHVLATNLAGTLSMNLLEQDMINNTRPRLNLQTFIGVVNVNIIWNNMYLMSISGLFRFVAPTDNILNSYISVFCKHTSGLHRKENLVKLTSFYQNDKHLKKSQWKKN